MVRSTRREFLRSSSVAAVGLAASQDRLLYASPLKLPVGLQLYSVRDQAEKNFEATLHQVASLGYKEVEAAGFFKNSAADVKKALKNTGLSCPSAHYSFQAMTKQIDSVLAYANELGLKYLVCPGPAFKDPSRVKNMTPVQRQDAYTMEDWRWNAEQFNQIGAKVKAAGMRFAYHNHVIEFKADSKGTIPLDEMLRLTDADKVSFEMDCGWVRVGGKDPVDYLKRYPTRICMLHLKDFKTVKPVADEDAAATELGRGVIDYRPIFAAANPTYVRHMFVEQEGYDMPVNDSLRMDAEYVKKLTA